MKNLLYKEFKLAMHPLVYMYLLLFPFMVLIPSYPIAIGFLYVIVAYPTIFLGAQKGQQNNDLLYSTLLPVRKKDIVKARIIFIIIIQFIFILLTSALAPVSKIITNSINAKNALVGLPPIQRGGFEIEGYVSVVSFALIGYGIADLAFFPIYYKNGKSIVKSTLITILAFAAYIIVFTTVLPSIEGFDGYINLFQNNGYGPQFIFLVISIAIYICLHFLVYKIASKRLEKVDF